MISMYAPEKIEKNGDRERVVAGFLRYVGASVGLGFVCFAFGFACGFYAGGLASLLWPAGTVLTIWFSAGAVAYFLLRDVIIRLFLGFLNQIISGSVYTSSGINIDRRGNFNASRNPPR